MDRLTKTEKRHYRQLLGLAHERELSAALKTLEDSFGRWKAGEIDAFELEDRIHRFHQHTAREIWSRYQFSSDSMHVVLASRIEQGVVKLEEVDSQHRPRIEGTLQAFRIAFGEKRNQAANKPKE